MYFWLVPILFRPLSTFQPTNFKKFACDTHFSDEFLNYSQSTASFSSLNTLGYAPWYNLSLKSHGTHGRLSDKETVSAGRKSCVLATFLLKPVRGPSLPICRATLFLFGGSYLPSRAPIFPVGANICPVGNPICPVTAPICRLRGLSLNF